MLKHFLAVLLLCAVPAIVQAQDATETAAGTIPPLTGDYTVQQSVGGQSQDGVLTIEGTGPIYTVSAKASDGSGAGTAPGLAQGDVLAVSGGSGNCAPATLVRQSDGTLFSHWIDTTVSNASLGFEYYTPKAKTTDFAGSYDFVGSYANGDQYKGTVEITKSAAGIYSLAYTYTADEYAPSSIPGNETGIGIANGNVLGYSFTEAQGASCGVLVIKFAADGSFTGEFTAGETSIGQASGTPKK